MSRTLIDALSAGLLAGGLVLVVHAAEHRKAPAAQPAAVAAAPAGRHDIDVRFEVADGKPTTVRFVLSRVTPTSFRLEQAVSRDDGKTWASNWSAIFGRDGENA